MPAWNIVPRTVFGGGGIDAALFEEDSLTPTSEILIDANPVHAAMKM